uniref:EF-hand domain-containing protein n=1 Tax=Octactis speculum TaxID=3111310 RepID=A0A7S2G4W8_9STRA|mmetsp:Transcript_38844/g.52683  ORF Transcript_38844/g.52683 Transcript_38844/m.52683 type:complete len:214 (+) Transcript_38844:119-760(+)
MDTDHSGKLSWHEFLAACMDTCKLEDDDKYLRMAFEHIDKDNKGRIVLDDIRSLMGDDATPEQVARVFQEVGQESIDYENFVAICRSKPILRRVSLLTNHTAALPPPPPLLPQPELNNMGVTLLAECRSSAAAVHAGSISIAGGANLHPYPSNPEEILKRYSEEIGQIVLNTPSDGSTIQATGAGSFRAPAGYLPTQRFTDAEMKPEEFFRRD